MKTRVQKWGNSLAVRIPKSFAEGMGIGNNAPVEMSLEEGALVIKADRDRQWDLDALLAEVTDENIHEEWEAEGAGEGSIADEPEKESRCNRCFMRPSAATPSGYRSFPKPRGNRRRAVPWSCYPRKPTTPRPA